MRALKIQLTFCLMLSLAGCGGKPAVPLSFYLNEQEQQKGVAIGPESKAALVVSRVEMVAPDVVKRNVTIKLLPADANAFEKLTTDNLGKTVTIVQGSNVLATPRIFEPIPAQAGVTFPIGTNIDFESAYRELVRLSK